MAASEQQTPTKWPWRVTYAIPDGQAGMCSRGVDLEAEYLDVEEDDRVICFYNKDVDSRELLLVLAARSFIMLRQLDLPETPGAE